MCVCVSYLWVWDYGHKTVFVVVETLLQVKEKTLRQEKGSENNVCIRVGPDGAASHDRFGTAREALGRSADDLPLWSYFDHLSRARRGRDHD